MVSLGTETKGGLVEGGARWVVADDQIGLRRARGLCEPLQNVRDGGISRRGLGLTMVISWRRARLANKQQGLGSQRMGSRNVKRPGLTVIRRGSCTRSPFLEEDDAVDVTAAAIISGDSSMKTWVGRGLLMGLQVCWARG